MVLFNPLQVDKGVHTFPKGISPKMNVAAHIVFKLAYDNVPVQSLNVWFK